MCYAIPGKVLNLIGEEAMIDFDGVRKKANMMLLPGAKEGDFVLVHAGFAIEKLTGLDAEKSLDKIRLLQKPDDKD